MEGQLKSLSPVTLAQWLSIYNNDPGYVAQGVRAVFEYLDALSMAMLLMDPSNPLDIGQLNAALFAAGYTTEEIVDVDFQIFFIDFENRGSNPQASGQGEA